MADEPEVAETETAKEPQETPEQTAPEEAPEAEAEQPDQPEAEAKDAPDGEVKSERGRKRVQDLANKAKAEKERADKAEEAEKSLRDEIASMGSDEPKKEEATQVRGGEQVPPWVGQIPVPEPGGEITPDKYREDVFNTAQTIVQAHIADKDRRDTVRDNLRDDMSYLEKSYPEAFDSDDKDLKESFRKSHENFLKAAKADPNVRFRDFAEPILKARSQGVEQGRDTASARLAEQKAEAAVKSDASKSSKRVTSTEQLEKMIANDEITPEEAEKQYPDLLL